jgi:hypothetical protein
MVAVDKFGGIGVEMADGVGKNIEDVATRQAERAKFNPRLHSPWPGRTGRQAAQKESPP